MTRNFELLLKTINRFLTLFSRLKVSNSFLIVSFQAHHSAVSNTNGNTLSVPQVFR